MKKVVVSGGFDPVHIGHLRMFQEAKKLGNYLTVILNSDTFLEKKKGYVFMSYEERKEIILGFECVDNVEKSIDTDNTVIKTIEKLAGKNKIDIFANGGDRKNIEDIPEYEICKKLDIELVFDIGGKKVQSSSELTKNKNYTEVRPWGSFENLVEENLYLVKRLNIREGEKISVQYHNHRSEKWIVVKGKALITLGEENFEASYGSFFNINPKEVHSIENIGNEDLEIIEVQLGKILEESDIVRLKDKYGRN